MLYLSGPMSGYPEFNYQAFERYASAFRRLGRVVVSPHELNPPSRNYWLCLAVDVWYLLRCREIALLPGWHKSRGAKIELAVALMLCMRVRLL